MKVLGKSVSVLIIALFAVSMAGCHLFSNRTIDKVERSLTSCGVRNVRTYSELLNTSLQLKNSSKAASYYFCYDEEAEKRFLKEFNKSLKLPKYQPVCFMAAFVAEQNKSGVQTTSVHTAEFRTEQETKRTYEQAAKELWMKKDDGKQVEDKNCSYTITYLKNGNTTTVYGVYAMGTSVTTIWATVDHKGINIFLEEFCKKMKWVSPASIVPVEE